MKRIFLMAALFSFVASAPVWAAAVSPTHEDKDRAPLKSDLFSVSSEDLDPSDSLNRVSGEYERGYSAPDQSYRSKDQHAAGPFAHEKAMTGDTQSY